MSTKSHAVIVLMKSWKGLKEGPVVDKKIIDPWNKVMHRSVKSKSTPWCAITVASCYIQCKLSGFSKSAGVKQQMAYYKKYKRFIARGKRPAGGDVIFLTGHEGIVTSTSYTGAGKYIAGNTSNMVKECSFNWKKPASSIKGYGRPIYK